MEPRFKIIRLYVLNFAFLATHEIDSAYWKEWDLFGIPGGIQAFLVLNFLLLLLMLYGLLSLMHGARNGNWFSIGLSAAGIFAFCIHTIFIVTGNPQFTLPVSLMVLLGGLVVSIFQAVLTIRLMRLKSTIV